MGRRIRARRVELGKSQADLAKALDVSFQQVQKYENGTNRIGAARLEALAKALDAPLSFFFGGNGKEREVERLISLDANFSIRLLKAYAAIPDRKMRIGFVSLLESVAFKGDGAR